MRKCDEVVWPPGPWDLEPKEGSKWLDEASGLWLETWRHPRRGHWCGYVYAPHDALRHFETDYGLDIPGAHCGITFDNDAGNGFRKVGFHCSHAWDLSPGLDYYSWSDDTYRDLAYVQRCLREMAAAIVSEQAIAEAKAGV